MALSYWKGTGDGVTTNYSVPFPYLQKAHVFVTVNGASASFTWLTDTTIQISPAPAAGSNIKIFRSSSPATALVDFTPGFLAEEDLDTAYLHTFYLAQEANDRADESILPDSASRWDAANENIINVADPINPQDAATKNYVEFVIDNNGFIPTPTSSGIGKFLKATTATAWNWFSLLASDISDATARGKALLTAASSDVVLSQGQAVRSNQVVMARNADTANDGSGGNWSVYLPNGSVLDTTGTTTQGLQEAINYAIQYGYDLFVYGGTVKPGQWPPPFTPGAGTDPSIIQCTSPISVPPAQKWNFRIQSATINFAIASAIPAWVWDSCMNVDFEFLGGQLVCAPNVTFGMVFQPTGELAQDSLGPVIGASRFRVPSVVMNGAVGACVKFDASSAPINENFFEFIEPNGGTAGILIDPSTHGFQNNSLRVVNCHSQTSQCLSLGIDATNGANASGNFVDFTCNPAAGAVGLDIFGANNVIKANVTNQIGMPIIGLKLEPSAAKNTIFVAGVAGTTPVSDVSTARSSALHFGNDFASVHLSATQNIPNNAWTKLLFDTEIADRMGTFDTVNHRWVPGIPGVALITATVNWTTALSVGTQLGMAIYRNGTLAYLKNDLSASASPNQGNNISVTVSIDNATDYFEVYVFQSSAGAANIDGTASNTHAQFVRLR